MALHDIGRALVLAVLVFQIVLADARAPVNYAQLVGYIKSGQITEFKRGLEGRTRDEIDLTGRSILMSSAITASQVDAIDVLLDWGMDPNRTLMLSGQGAAIEPTPLIFAISAKAKLGIVKQLISRGADVNQGSEGLLPLNFALSMQQFELGALLLDNGAQAAATHGAMGMTPLMALSMAQTADEKTLSSLAKRIAAMGGNVNARTKRGGTALTFAITSGNPVMVHILLELGANPNIKNDKGESPLAIASRRQRDDLVSLLKQFGAQP